MAISKVIYGGQTLIDLTADTVTPETLAEGVKAHDKTGALIIGTMKAGAKKVVSNTNVEKTTTNINKVIYGGQTLIDLTADTVTPETLAEGVKAHDKTGTLIIGTMKAKILHYFIAQCYTGAMQTDDYYAGDDVHIYFDLMGPVPGNTIDISMSYADGGRFYGFTYTLDRYGNLDIYFTAPDDILYILVRPDGIE